MSTSVGRIRPSGWWYAASVGVVVVALILAVITVLRALDETRDLAFEVNAAGVGETQTLTIDEPGGFTIGYVGPIKAFGESSQRELARDLAPSVAPAAGGAALPLLEYDGFYDTTRGNDQYVALYTVSIDVPGDYAIRSQPLVGVDPERARLVLMKSPFAPLRRGLVRAVVLVVVGIGLGTLSAVIVGVTRGRAKRVRRTAAWAASPVASPGHPAPGYPAPGYPAPGHPAHGPWPPGPPPAR